MQGKRRGLTPTRTSTRSIRKTVPSSIAERPNISETRRRDCLRLGLLRLSSEVQPKRRYNRAAKSQGPHFIFGIGPPAPRRTPGKRSAPHLLGESWSRLPRAKLRPQTPSRSCDRHKNLLPLRAMSVRLEFSARSRAPRPPLPWHADSSQSRQSGRTLSPAIPWHRGLRFHLRCTGQ